MVSIGAVQSGFLKRLGFNTVGVDISENMLTKAREIDPEGDYRLVGDGDFSHLQHNAYDLVLSAFTFDNIPTMKKKVGIFREIRDLLREDGRIVNLVSSPEIYTHEWASFSTKDYPENKHAESGDQVRIVQTDTDDKRAVVDIIWTPASYLETFKKAKLMLIKTYKPLANESEPYQWVNETKIPPWTIYVLGARSSSNRL